MDHPTPQFIDPDIKNVFAHVWFETNQAGQYIAK